MSTMFVIAYLSVLLIAALPRWRYNRNWGYYPCYGVSAVLGTVLLFTFI